MAKLRIPSAQHLARNYNSDPLVISRNLVNLAENPPWYTYRPLFQMVPDMLLFKQPLEELEAGLIKGMKNEKNRNGLLEVLRMVHSHFSEVPVDFFQRIDRRYFPIGRNLSVPFDPPLIYGSNGRLIFPWFSFWKSQPLSGKKLSLFVAMVDFILMQDPDLEEAEFEILDFSAPNTKSKRVLNVINSKDVKRLSEKEMWEMLEIFAVGFKMATDHLAANVTDPKPVQHVDPRQGDLFS